MLTAVADARPELGLRVWKPAHMRSIENFKRVPGMFRGEEFASDEARARFEALQGDLDQRLAEAKKDGVQTLLISEENICGGMKGNFRKKQFYPSMKPRLRAFARLFPRPARVALGLREYGAVWNSAYGYLDRPETELPTKPDAAAILTETKIGWPALTRAMQDAWPEADIMVWRQEDLGAVEVAAKLCDLDLALLEDPGRAVNATGSAGGIPTELFTKPERRKLDRRYEAHIGAMLEDPSLTWAVRP